MRIFLEKTASKDALDEIQCNLCGVQIQKNDLGYFEDHLSVNKTWGYGKPADGETHSFDLCYDCYTDMLRNFKIPPLIFAGMHEKDCAQHYG